MKLRRRKPVERRRAAKAEKKKRRCRKAGGREGIWERASGRQEQETTWIQSETSPASCWWEFWQAVATLELCRWVAAW